MSNFIDSLLLGYDEPNNTDNVSILSSTPEPVALDLFKSLSQEPSSHINKSYLIYKTQPYNQIMDYHLPKLELFIGRRKFNNSANRGKYYNILDTVIANLLSCYRTDTSLIYSRHRATMLDVKITEVIDYLSSCGCLIDLKSTNGYTTGLSSFCYPYGFLVEQFKANQNLLITTKGERIVVRGENGKPLSYDRFKRKSASLIKSMEETIFSYDELMSQHPVTFKSSPLHVSMTRIFNVAQSFTVDGFSLGGRFYRGEQFKLSKVERATVRIDNEPTDELDYQSMHLVMLYNQVGLELLTPVMDPYDYSGVADFSRNTGKLLTLQAVNSSGFSSLKRMVTTSGKPENINRVKQYRSDVRRYLQRAVKGLYVENPPFLPKNLKEQFIDGVPEGLDGDVFIKALIAKHGSIASLFGADNLALKLQNRDSIILDLVMQRLIIYGIPFIAIHDSVRVKRQDSMIATEIMKESYKDLMGFFIKVSIS